MERSWLLAIVVIASASFARAHAQDPSREQAAPETQNPHSDADSRGTSDSPFLLGGYAEAFYQWNFNRPSNDITNYRGFDNRHNTFTLANVALDAQWDYKDVIGRITLQVGLTPSTYYSSEPKREGTSSVSDTGPELWKYLQQAFVGYRFTRVLTVTAGLFLSPIGLEAMAIKDNWNWSRSNLFFGLPFYHTGARATYTLSRSCAFTLAAYNGWNSVVDNNSKKSLSAQVTYTHSVWQLSLLYFGGSERPQGSPEGQPWRHLFDAHATWNTTRWLSLMAHVNAGFEPSRIGNARWTAGALYGRAKLMNTLYLALRGDLFYEHTPEQRGVGASALFWPVPWVSSLTSTLEYRPTDHVSFRAEYRHDQAQGAMYFGGTVANDPTSLAYVPDRRAQNTLTLGTTAWF